jgi:hypothetical protein
MIGGLLSRLIRSVLLTGQAAQSSGKNKKTTEAAAVVFPFYFMRLEKRLFSALNARA